jgi:laccase
LSGNTCNTAGDRSAWCNGYDINTDYNAKCPDTGKTVSYDWVITNTTLDFDGVKRLALAINGQVPGPLVEANWGDTVSVRVTNEMQDNATSVGFGSLLSTAMLTDTDSLARYLPIRH